MRILLFEDNAKTKRMLKEYLTRKEYIVNSCGTCGQAIQKLDKIQLEKGNFDCYILDLNASSAGLGKEYELYAKQCNDIITGWFLLQRIINEYDEKAIKKVIFFSAFVTELDVYIKNNDPDFPKQPTDEEKESYEYILSKNRIISKDQALSRIDDILEEIKKYNYESADTIKKSISFNNHFLYNG